MSMINAATISQVAVELLARTIVLPQTVTRVPVADYTGSGGKTLIRVPQRRTASEVDGSLEYSSIDETPVELDVTRWYDGVSITNEDSTLSLVVFGRQVIAPMTAAISEAGEDVLGVAMNGVESSFDWSDLTDPEKTRDDVLLIRETLTTNKAPQGNRTLACAPDVVTGLLRIENFVKANEAGTTDALRNALVGRVFGLDVVESPALEAGSAVGYHRSGFAFATMSPSLPFGGAAAAASEVNGIALRTVFAYDTATGGDVILLDTYGGAVMTDADRVVRVGSEESS
jgi:hypothetical protein